MGESKLPSSSFCVRVFFALSHCSKVILKFINKTKWRYSIVWAPESLIHWIGLKPKTKNTNANSNKRNKALKWSWTRDFVKEGQLMCFRHSFLWIIWCLSIIICCQDLGKGVFFCYSVVWSHRGHGAKNTTRNLGSHWLSSDTYCGAFLLFPWSAFFLLNLFCPFFSVTNMLWNLTNIIHGMCHSTNQYGFCPLTMY